MTFYNLTEIKQSTNKILLKVIKLKFEGNDEWKMIYFHHDTESIMSFDTIEQFNHQKQILEQLGRYTYNTDKDFKYDNIKYIVGGYEVELKPHRFILKDKKEEFPLDCLTFTLEGFLYCGGFHFYEYVNIKQLSIVPTPSTKTKSRKQERKEKKRQARNGNRKQKKH